MTKQTFLVRDMLILEINLPPVPQKQTRFYVQKGRCFGVDPSKQDKEQIQWQIRPYAPTHPYEGAVQLDITFFMQMPKAPALKTKQMINGTILPIKRPDLDNLSYLVVNAMKGIIYEDDSQIVDLNLHKRYGEVPKTIVKVIELCA